MRKWIRVDMFRINSHVLVENWLWDNIGRRASDTGLPTWQWRVKIPNYYIEFDETVPENTLVLFALTWS